MGAMTSTPEYDIALSFAGEDRSYVDAVALELRDRGVKVFYDLFEEANLWGKDLYAHLIDVYQRQARYTVMFISDAYGRKLWTNHERRAAQARAFQESREYILPARFDDTEIPGVLLTVGYISLKGRPPVELASLIVKKLVSAGGTVPTELVRRDFSTVTSYQNDDPTLCAVTVVDDEGMPIADAMVTAQADNGTAVEGRSDAEGKCTLTIHTRRNYTMLVAHPQYPAAQIENVDPAEGKRVTLPRTDNVGSVIINSTGHILGLKGRLNPIRDRFNRLYLYADNISIDGGKHQPATFEINNPIELEDCEGTIVLATVKHVAGRFALLQHTRRPAAEI